MEKKLEEREAVLKATLQQLKGQRKALKEDMKKLKRELKELKESPLTRPLDDDGDDDHEEN
jgi:phage shock protein A